MGRPKARDDLLQKAIEVLEQGGTVKDAARVSGLSKTTLHKYGITRRKVVKKWSQSS